MVLRGGTGPRPGRGLLGPRRLRPRAPAGAGRGVRPAGRDERPAADGRGRGAAPGTGAELITTDGYSGYASVFQRVFGTMVKPTHKRGEPNRGGPKRLVPPELTHAIVQKVIEKGRVVEVKRELSIGTQANLDAALSASTVNTQVNTSFVERHNATDRHRNARKSRRTYRFSKEREAHDAAGYFTLYSYNFCWAVRTLRQAKGDGTYRPRTPAMAAGLADHVWTVAEWLGYPARDDSS